MIEGSLSRRYTRALFQLARESGKKREIGQEIESFLGVYAGGQLQKVLTNPAFGMDSRRSRHRSIEPAATFDFVIHFLSLLLERDRLPYLPSIVTRYRRLLDEDEALAGS